MIMTLKKEMDFVAATHEDYYYLNFEIEFRNAALLRGVLKRPLIRGD
jgi:hypothetical protein